VIPSLRHQSRNDCANDDIGEVDNSFGAHEIQLRREREALSDVARRGNGDQAEISVGIYVATTNPLLRQKHDGGEDSERA
jgi:hypothetical protein